jgi:hypothetical protein
MKITSAHYAHMKFAIAKIPAKDVTAVREFIVNERKTQAIECIGNERKAQDIDMRLRWDIAHRAGLTSWFCDEIYSYADDDHIDTALRKIMRELFGI